MTTNVCDKEIQKHAEINEQMYLEVGDNFEVVGNNMKSSFAVYFASDITSMVHSFVELGGVSLFLHMARQHPGFQHPRLSDITTVGNTLIEK